MSKIACFVIWICSKFTRAEIEQILAGLSDVLSNRNPEIKLKDDFKEKHPNYRIFSVDPLPPLTEPSAKQPVQPAKDYELLLSQYQTDHGKELRPVKQRANSPKVPSLTVCPLCNAPHSYIYYNDGNKRTQLKCKVCGHLFQLNQRFRKNEKSKYFCPYCNLALFRWKVRKEVTIYKCSNDNCPHRTAALNKLNPSERSLQNKRSSQFKLCYQYREYHYKPNELNHCQPDNPKVDLTKIHNAPNVLGLILTFYVSFAITARKTAFILRSVFNIKVSYQTVLNYASAAAFYCHAFNMKYKGPIDSISAGDETYIKVHGKHNYVFVKPSHGFNCSNGAVSLTTLFVTHYNFLRPHMSLHYNTPVQMPEVQNISTLQGKWAKILSLAA